MVDIDREYLKRKHQGGESSQRGNLYESYFAVYQILLLMSQGKGDAKFFSQVEGAYVDDLLILLDGCSVYHQIKDVKKLSWGNIEESKTLASDFFHQVDICTSKKVDFLLKLIVSSGKERLDEKMPQELEAYSKVEEFPAYNNINRYIFNPLFYSIAAKAIDVGEKQHYVVSTFVTMLFGKWCGKMYEGKNVESIILDVKRALAGVGIDELTLNKIKEKLCQLGFIFRLDSSILCWQYLGFEGEVELTEDKIVDILHSADAESMVNVLF